MLKIDPDHPKFEDLVPGEVKDFEFTGDVQQVTLGPGTYRLETWGAQRR
jgi:hypothetical protein